MSVIKWISGSAVAAVVAFALLVPKRADERFSNELARARSTVRLDYKRARGEALALRELTKRADVRAIANALPPVAAGSPLVRIDGLVPAAVAARVRDRFASEIRTASAGPSRHPLALIVTVDSAIGNAVFQHTIALPERAGAPCTIVVTATPARMNRLGTDGPWNLLGTCAFYAAFGAPGTAVDAWLRSTRFASARYLRSPSSLDGETSGIDLSSSYALYYRDGFQMASCRAGRTASCAAFLSPDPRAVPPFEPEPALLDELASFEPGTEVGSFYRFEGARWNAQGGLLSALVSDLGSERFGELWRGPNTLAESYAAEAGRPLTDFVADYVARRTLPYRAGPGLPPVPAALGTALILFALLIALRYAPRRAS